MQKVIEFILPITAEFEGFRANVYKCPAGFDTIGYGRNIQANPLSAEEKAQLNADGSISEEVARLWLQKNLEKCYLELVQNFKWFERLDTKRKGALVDFLYNVGLGTLKSFKNTLRFLEVGDFKQAAENLRQSKWFSQVKRRGVRIAEIIEKGV